MTPDEQLSQRLMTVWGRSESEQVVSAIRESRSGSRGVAGALEILVELHDVSSKAERIAIESLPELQRRGVIGSVLPWLDLGVAIAGVSGATAMKYFKETPLLLGLIESAAARDRALKVGLELADAEPNVALEFLRAAPELVTTLEPDAWPVWAELGVEVVRDNYILGIEFIRQCPAVARVLPIQSARDWVAFGSKLITLNSLGKTDYVGTLEFFRTSPGLLADIEGQTARSKVVDLGSTLADRDPAAAVMFLSEAPALLRRIERDGARLHVLRYGALLAERDGEATLGFMRRCPEVLALLGSGAAADEKFDAWFAGGMEVLAHNVEGARAYFALETERALASVEQAMNGVSLRQVARELKLFAQGLCGVDLRIEALPDSIVEASGVIPRPALSADRQTIRLPALVRRAPSKGDNARLYSVMVAHESGHLEFGTYAIRAEWLQSLAVDVIRRYRAGEAVSPSPDGRTPAQSLGDVFRSYPQPGLIRDLWTILEDARVEWRLRQEYPGLKQDLTTLAREAVLTRSLTQGLSVRELVVDCLLLMTTQGPDAVEIPASIQEIMDRVWPLCETLFTSGATAEDAVRQADRVYVVLEEMVAALGSRAPSDDEVSGQGAHETGPRASEEGAGEYRPATNFSYRGTMDPDHVRADHASREEQDGEAEPVKSESTEGGAGEAKTHGSAGAGQSGAEGRRRDNLRQEQRDRDAEHTLTPGRTPGDTVEDMLLIPTWSSSAHPGARLKDGGMLYDEWDGGIQDYRVGWCRVMERRVPEGPSEFVEATLAEHGASIRVLRRYFESLKPPAFRRVRGQPDGEDLDLDALVRRIAETRAGIELSERIYVRREKRERDIAAAFVVDLSGSTSRQIEGDRRRVIDVEKEGLILLIEALGAIGDQYAVYGYSGQGRHTVDFMIVKEFDEPSDARVMRRIGAMRPLQQNRDGAAIRHAVAKLKAREAKGKVLILLSDGKPLDDGYGDEYALEDTRMALREARQAGIQPFCITVDEEASAYLRRMYGEVRYLIIDRISALPERLPRVYQRLTA